MVKYNYKLSIFEIKQQTFLLKTILKCKGRKGQEGWMIPIRQNSKGFVIKALRSFSLVAPHAVEDVMLQGIIRQSQKDK